jgi:hypothetical protein
MWIKYTNIIINHLLNLLTLFVDYAIIYMHMNAKSNMSCMIFIENLTILKKTFFELQFFYNNLFFAIPNMCITIILFALKLCLNPLFFNSNMYTPIMIF